jgi:hypothetical protein
MLGKVFLMFTSFGLYPIQAQAYVDPGTGSMLAHVITSSLLALGIFWRRVLAFCRKLMGKDPSAGNVVQEKTEK